MSELEQIESRIKSLSPGDLRAEFDAQVWDRQIEADSVAGRVDGLVEESMNEYKAGRSRAL